MTPILLLLTILISLSDKNFLDAQEDDHAVRYGTENSYACRTKHSGEGVEGKDFDRYHLSNRKCEAECTKRNWCKAIEIEEYTWHCELWYYKPKYESKHGHVCKWKKYDDYDDGHESDDVGLKPCEEEGYKAANNLFWEEFWEECDNIFEFAEKASKDLLRDRFEGHSKNNKCARDGVEKFVDESYEKCLTQANCVEYGQLAAELVINNFCQLNSGAKVYEPKEIKRACKEKARVKCRDSLYSTIEDLVITDGYLCPKFDDYYDYVDELREECRIKVLKLMKT